jgi:hypothetical protein
VRLVGRAGAEHGLLGELGERAFSASPRNTSKPKLFCSLAVVQRAVLATRWSAGSADWSPQSPSGMSFAGAAGAGAGAVATGSAGLAGAAAGLASGDDSGVDGAHAQSVQAIKAARTWVRIWKTPVDLGLDSHCSGQR